MALDIKHPDQELLDFIDALAEIEHERWADWQAHVFNVSVKNEDGSVTIPAEYVSRWERQVHTPYIALSEDDKQKDRNQVGRYLPSVIDFMEYEVQRIFHSNDS